MQKRIPILVDEKTYEELRKLAYDTHSPMAGHIRSAIEKYLQEQKKKGNVK